MAFLERELPPEKYEAFVLILRKKTSSERYPPDLRRFEDLTAWEKVPARLKTVIKNENLSGYNFYTVDDLLSRTGRVWLQTPNFGRRGLLDLNNFLAGLGHTLREK